MAHEVVKELVLLLRARLAVHVAAGDGGELIKQIRAISIIA
jgi:hypothetical protein